MEQNKLSKLVEEGLSIREISAYVSTSNLKNRLIKEGFLKNKCDICGLEGVWQGQSIVMVLDHINGINNDNRKENLRLLCPNCNSQQPTFCRKQAKNGLSSGPQGCKT